MFDSVAAGETVDADASAALAEQHARIAREQFREIDWVTTLFVVRCEEDARAGRNEARHGEFAHVEVAGILGLTESAARRMIDLRWRLHQVRAELQVGRIDLAKAHALSEALSNVSDDKLEDIERRLLDGAGRSTTSRLKERARRLIARLDPDGVRERRLRATDDRDVRVIAGDTHLACRCGRPDCTAEPGTVTKGAGMKVQLLVGVNASTLRGFDDAPGYLSGYGAIDADLARELAADATWKRILMLSAADRAGLAEGSLSGPVLGSGPPLPAPKHSPPTITARTRKRLQERTYRPSGRLSEIVRTRDGVCRFPNCAAAAATCDLDHTIPFDHDHPERGGLTTESNLACLCRTHHRLETLGYWSVRQIGEGRLEWLDPTGRATITHPRGPFADPEMQPDLTAGLDDRLTARLTDARTLARLNYSTAEGDLDYLLDSLIPARHRRRPAPRTSCPVGTIDYDGAPPF
ncbi:HNH endonuclease signature motif containing protein [Prescottella equi]|uniref:HNH endonuclease signature motif containing protein n=2 Tax=Rhodococcus hoagii TaxID=43767 RepID=UPI001EDE2D59|nr:HNH endonuclease signature motif containing protein [Prescottella equi]